MTYSKRKSINPTVVSTDILYRKITEEDFSNDCTVKDVELKANDNGYISAGLLGHFDYENSDTSILNIGTGQGKSTAVIKIAKKYYEDGYLVFIASPTKNLVSKYLEKLSEGGIPESDISDYRTLNNSDNNLDLEKKMVHVITINSLLGNPGDNYFKTSQQKEDYLNGLLKRCELEKLKIVMIFDEIHEGVHNFKPEYFYKFLRFKEYTHKVIVASATFTEPSIIVLNHLALLTDLKVYIFDSPRIKLGKQAKLYLIFIEENYSSKNLEPLYLLKKILKNAKKLSKSVNILSYSKNLVDSIEKSAKKGKFLKELELFDQEINKITSETETPFDENKINIGTTFKSGIDIINPESVYFIIMPPKNVITGLTREGDLGIFTKGASEVIQAIARVRNGGDIFIFTPYPPSLIKGDGYIKELKQNLFHFAKIDREADFFKPDEMKDLIKEHYNEQRKEIEVNIQEIKALNNNFDYLPYPSLNEWCFQNGHKFLISKYEIFGHKVIPFLVWAAMNDQFQNCKLETIYFKINPEEITFKDKDIESLDVLHKIEDYFGSGFYHNGFSNLKGTLMDYTDKEKYDYIYKFFTKDNRVKFQKNQKQNELRKAIIGIVNFYKPGFNYRAEKAQWHYNFKETPKNYTLCDYILNNISLSNFVKEKNLNSDLTSAENELLNAYLKLGRLREEFLKEVNSEPKLYVNLSTKVLSDKFIYSARDVIDLLNQCDKFIKDQTFSFIQKIKTDDLKKAENIIYKGFIKAFNSDLTIKKDTNRFYSNPIFKEIPLSINTINLIFPSLTKGYELTNLKKVTISMYTIPYYEKE